MCLLIMRSGDLEDTFGKTCAPVTWLHEAAVRAEISSTDPSLLHPVAVLGSWRYILNANFDHFNEGAAAPSATELTRQVAYLREKVIKLERQVDVSKMENQELHGGLNTTITNAMLGLSKKLDKSHSLMLQENSVLKAQCEHLTFKCSGLKTPEKVSSKRLAFDMDTEVVDLMSPPSKIARRSIVTTTNNVFNGDNNCVSGCSITVGSLKEKDDTGGTGTELQKVGQGQKQQSTLGYTNQTSKDDLNGKCRMVNWLEDGQRLGLFRYPKVDLLEHAKVSKHPRTVDGVKQMHRNVCELLQFVATPEERIVLAEKLKEGEVDRARADFYKSVQDKCMNQLHIFEGVPDPVKYTEVLQSKSGVNHTASINAMGKRI